MSSGGERNWRKSEKNCGNFCLVLYFIFSQIKLLFNVYNQTMCGFESAQSVMLSQSNNQIHNTQQSYLELFV